MYTGVFEPPPPPLPPPQVATDVWMKNRARRATAIERKSWFFMARDYSRAGFEERAFDAGSWPLGWTMRSEPGTDRGPRAGRLGWWMRPGLDGPEGRHCQDCNPVATAPGTDSVIGWGLTWMVSVK